MEEIKITAAKMKGLHDGLASYPEAQNAIKNAFPEAFEDGWVDVTENLKFCPYKATSFYWIGIYQEGISPQIGWLDSAGAHICTHAEKSYKVEKQKTRGYSVFGDNYFRILKRQ